MDAADNMTLDGGAKKKTVVIRDGADEAEVSTVITEGCRDAGVTDDDQASSIIANWKAWKLIEPEQQRMGYQRTGLGFEETGSKNIFERFLGRMATIAEAQPFAVLENHLIVTKVADDRFATHDSEVVLGDESRLDNLAANGGLIA